MTSACPRRRSRYGCRNCKLRKLKCDEGKPQCRRCTSFGLLCNFISNTPDLQPVTADGVQGLIVRRRADVALQPPITSAIWTADESTTYQLNAKCQDFITRYLRESLITPDDPNLRHVNRQLLRLAFTYPYLMHASLAVAFTYDQYLNTSSPCTRTPDVNLNKYYHQTQATSLLHNRLLHPLPPTSTSTDQGAEKDAIWGTAAALALLTFSSPISSTPSQSWPLTPPSPNDLSWLRILNGKMSLWHIVDPLRPESLFSVMKDTFAQMNAPFPEKGVVGIPPSLAAVCALDSESTVESNPYFEAAHAVSTILNLPDEAVTTGQTQLFIRCIYGEFERLLVRDRDPVALLCLYLWYRKAGRGVWWIGLRARVEGPAICEHLQLYYGGNAAVQGVLACY